MTNCPPAASASARTCGCRMNGSRRMGSRGSRPRFTSPTRGCASWNRSQMLEVEGGTHDWCMRILRHEAGHALDNAYRLHRRTRYRELFGSYHEPYPDSYRPKPYTKRFVIHLDMWYAQAHPAEDFAETFAVWLNPDSHWRQQYANWPALRKLQVRRRADGRSRREPRPSCGRAARTHPLRTLTTYACASTTRHEAQILLPRQPRLLRSRPAPDLLRSPRRGRRTPPRLPRIDPRRSADDGFALDGRVATHDRSHLADMITAGCAAWSAPRQARRGRRRST